jgi:hypothetical protein
MKTIISMVISRQIKLDRGSWNFDFIVMIITPV